MNTSNLNTLRRSVGQLDKTTVFQPKASKNKGLEVGRHTNQVPHTSARTHTGGLEEENPQIALDLSAMIYLNKLLADLLPELKVCYHNTLYVQQIEEIYPPNESRIFLQFVQAFAQFRHTDRIEPLTNVILTNENDFLRAFKLMQGRRIAEYSSIKPKNRNKVLDFLTLNFQQRTFTAKIIAKELFYNYAFINKILVLLILEHEIEFFKEFNGEKVYRLRQKPTVYVTGN